MSVDVLNYSPEETKIKSLLQKEYLSSPVLRAKAERFSFLFLRLLSVDGAKFPNTLT